MGCIIGNTPLQLAAKVGNLSVVTYLVGEERADIYAKNQYGQTPISLAAKNNHLEHVFKPKNELICEV